MKHLAKMSILHLDDLYDYAEAACQAVFGALNKPGREGAIEKVLEEELGRLRLVQQHVAAEIDKRSPRDERESAMCLRLKLAWALECGDDPTLARMVRTHEMVEA